MAEETPGKWEIYSSKLFLPIHSAVVAQLEAWVSGIRGGEADPDPDKHVVILVGPPGTGKTWVMRNLEEFCRTHQRLVFWLSVPELCSMDPSNNLVYDEAKAYAWLRYAYAEACKCGVAVAPASVSPGLYSVSTYVLELAAEISSIAWRYLPLLLVDGYDEVPVEQAVTISRAILDHFLTDCTRLILGIRDPIIPRTYVIKSSENHLKLMDIKINPEDHFVRFKTCFYPNAVHLDVVNLSQWQSTIAGYNWQHPYINAFLFDRALSANPANFPNLLTPNDLKDCCLHLINRQRKVLISDVGFARLKIIAHQLPQTWAPRDLRLIAMTDDDIEELFKFGTIYNLPYGKREVIDGLRELLRNIP